MVDNTTQFTNQAQQATQSMVEAMQGIAGVQSNIVQRLAEVQQSVLRQATEASNEQLQLIGQSGDPRGFASAQADLVRRHGQRYADQVKETVDVIAQAWEEYGKRLENSTNTVGDKAQGAASTAKKSS